MEAFHTIVLFINSALDLAATVTFVLTIKQAGTAGRAEHSSVTPGDEHFRTTGLSTAWRKSRLKILQCHTKARHLQLLTRTAKKELNDKEASISPPCRWRQLLWTGILDRKHYAPLWTGKVHLRLRHQMEAVGNKSQVSYLLVWFFLNPPLFMKWHDDTMAMLGQIKGASSPATRLQSTRGAQRDEYTAVVLAQEYTPTSQPPAAWDLLTHKFSVYHSGRNQRKKLISAPSMAARLMKRVQDDHL